VENGVLVDRICDLTDEKITYLNDSLKSTLKVQTDITVQLAGNLIFIPTPLLTKIKFDSFACDHVWINCFDQLLINVHARLNELIEKIHVDGIFEWKPSNYF
jgi:hypothetical protein